MANYSQLIMKELDGSQARDAAGPWQEEGLLAVF